MARYRDDDDFDDRPRRRREYDGPPRKNNTALILIIIALAVGLPMLACGGIVVWGVMAAKQGINQLATTIQSELAATTFLTRLETGDLKGAYADTTSNFKATMRYEEFQALVQSHPVLTSTHRASQSGFPNPTGSAPNRTVAYTFTVSPSQFGGPNDDPFDTPSSIKTPETRPKPPSPATNPDKPAPEGVTCTITLAEQADGTWKVDGFVISGE